MKAVFFRALKSEDKAAVLLDGVAFGPSGPCGTRFEADPLGFDAIPRSPFAYWVSDSVRTLFQRVPPFGRAGTTARVGLQTSDDPRFVRTWWEVASTGARWFLFAKGGEFGTGYSDVHLVVDWEPGERALWATENPTIGRPFSNIWMLSETIASFFFRPGLTWPRRTTSGLGMRALAAGCIFADKGPAAFVDGDDPTVLLAILALTNSAPFGGLVALQLAAADAAARSYEVGVIQRTPVPALTPEDEVTLAALARRAWSLKRSLDTVTENSHAFTLPALLQSEGRTLSDRAAAWAAHLAAVETELAEIQAEIDDRCFTLYCIEGEDRRQIEEGFGPAEDVGDGEDSDEEDDDADQEPVADVPALAAALVSWAVGVAFGRFDVRLATGGRLAPSEPEPFDALPVCSAGMLQGEDSLPVGAPPTGYPFSFSTDGILTDDPGHPQDLLGAVTEVFWVVFGDDADARLEEAARELDPRGHDIRTYLRKGFFEFHLKRYSKSRRKAPLFWQLATPSGSYALWLHYPRLTKDTFFRAVNDVVIPKLQHEETKLTRLAQEGGPEPSRSQRQALDDQETFVAELRAFREELSRIAPPWDPDPDDGVLVNASLLWRLFPQHKAWQKECRDCFDKLTRGDYDWAHLAMHLWPERVVSKCTEDRSLAIAHGLEEEFWHKDDGGAWHPRRPAQDELTGLIQARTSASVQAALESLLGAPGVGGGAARGRGGRR